MSTTCPICAYTLDNSEYRFLGESNLWRIVLAPNQALLGRCVVHLKRHAGDLAQLTTDEVLDWLTVVQCLEAALRDAFQPALFNWSCYMNHAYRDQQPDPHTHWWAVPRYAREVQFSGVRFEDPHFGNPYDHYRWRDVSPSLQEQIARRIRAHLHL